MKGFATAVRQGSRGFRFSATGILIVVPVLGAFAACASATVLSGSLRSSLYLQESRLGAGSYETRVIYQGVGDTTRVPDSLRNPLQNRARLIEEARLDALQLGVKPLGFHASFSAGNILTDQSLQETAFRLHRAYFQWNGMRRGPGAGYDVRVGRQWVLAGVGSGTIDGLSAKLSDSRLGDLTVFGGTLGTDRILRTDKFWSLDKPGQSRAVGGRLRVQRSLGPVLPTVSFSLSQVDRKPGTDLVTDAQRAGFSAELRASRHGSLQALRGFRAWGDLRRDIIWGNNISLVGGLDCNGDLSSWLSWLPLHRLGQDFRGRIEYGRRRPDLRATSHFASFVQDPRKELRGGAGATVLPGVRLDVDGDYSSSAAGEKENGVAATASGYGLTVGYRWHRGYGGGMDGLIVYGHREIFEKLALDVAVDHSRYDYGDIPDERDFDANTTKDTSGMLALGYRLRPDLSLTGQVEGLRNGGMNKDLRFLGIVDWRFRTAF
jgi:hypothetical protein